ncbi:MAG: tRNA 2-thiouridine(34) synthase MnmA [Lachnospiraceae bacterium]|nr:tRNA 2-thiouridine(34) synthase MnmA [Lachnospiraceae bacterium]
MSGGVDSSVAAYLMKAEGYRCMGTTMRLYENNDALFRENNTCCSRRDFHDACEVALKLGIHYEVLDLTRDFKECVIDKFIRTYEEGGVPNPCVDCNRYIKFGRLFDFADRNGLWYVVTGHYARIGFDPDSDRYFLKKARYLEKDQSYVLYMLTQKELARLKLPLGELKKEETRKIAEEQGFCNAEKHDSQDICFVPDGDYAAFMEKASGKKYPDGQIKDESGNVLGIHHGAVRYTTGQRRGLGIASEKRLYVTGKDMESNTVYLGPESALYSDTLYASEVNWISGEVPKEPLRVRARVRYRQEEKPATVFPEGPDRLMLKFDEPLRAITAGQAAVLYDAEDGDTVLGGGTIAADLNYNG